MHQGDKLHHNLFLYNSGSSDFSHPFGSLNKSKVQISAKCPHSVKCLEIWSFRVDEQNVTMSDDVFSRTI